MTDENNGQRTTDKKQDGRENVEKGLNLYLANLKKYENLAVDILYAPQFLLPAMNYYVENNERRKAADLWQKGFINRVETFLQKSPGDVGMLNQLVEGFSQKGDCLSGYSAESKSFAETNPAFLKEALDNYEKSLAQVKKNLTSGESAFETKQKGENLEFRISMLRERLAKKF